MTNMIEVNVENLSGTALDWCMTIVNGAEVRFDYGRACLQYPGSCALMDGQQNTRYITTPKWSASWDRTGPLIEQLLKTGQWEIAKGSENQEIRFQNFTNEFLPVDGESHDQDDMFFDSDSLLVAGCRAIVAAKLGAVVSVPAELVPA